LQPPQGAAQLGPQAGAQQLGSQAGAQQVGSQQLLPQEPQPHPPKLHFGSFSFGRRSFGSLNFGRCSLGILKQEPHPLSQHPQLSPQVLQQSTGAQQVGSQHALPQAAGAQQVGSQHALPQAAGAQQEGSQAGAQPWPQPLSHPTGAQQLASTGAQQVGSTLQPQPLLWLNRPNKPACALFAIEKTTRAAESVNAFISVLLHIVLAE